MEYGRARDEAVPSPDAPELPTDRAFVLQLSRESAGTSDSFIGRVEHLASGRRLRFNGLAELQAAVIRLITENERDEGRNA